MSTATPLRRIGRDARYLLTGLPVAIPAFVLVITFFALGMGTLVIVAGLPILVVAVHTARLFADVERSRMSSMLGRQVSRPHYAKAPEGSGFFRRQLTQLRQGQSWLDLLHAIVNFPMAVAAFALTLSFWAVALGGLTYWIWGRFLPYDETNNDIVTETIMGSDSLQNRIILNTTLGVLFVFLTPLLQRGIASVQAGVSHALLCQLAQLQGRITDLTESRAAAVSAEATALRKLERDIHDGPQQQLIRLAMDLSRAQRQVASDPEAARETLTAAITQTKEALGDLRALSRGIAPPVLADRGLAAALTTVASRSTVPVSVEVALDGRPNAAIENALYFTAAEALANIAKHSGATEAAITLTRQDDHLYLVVQDNGTGGAQLAKGHGLAGLADRLKAVDGQLVVDSPAGGPTVLVAEVPVT
ncbi:sensor histidine kinase [Longispora albida]|uniref:sensor histidine kinase n=1 Tax=Longispora albida TaxID=203523 RepID=UPI00037527CC|nr:sensor histidine kinase [Longispora albida]